MVSKSVARLLDEAIIPAVVLILAKLAGTALAIKFLNIPFEIEKGRIFFFLPGVRFETLQDYSIAENYSNLAMFVCVALGTIFVLVKAHFFHESHISPKLHSRLVSLNLENWIAPSYHLYHQAAIWLIFLWLTVGFLIISTLLKVTYPQITIIAAIIAANFSWVFAVDVEKEIELSKE